MAFSCPSHQNTIGLPNLLSVGEGSFSTIHLMLSETYLCTPLTDYASIQNGLVNYFFSLSIFEDAFEAFLDSKYRMFDALIGNNSCYSVAYIVFLIAQRNKDDTDFRNSVLLALEQIGRTKINILQILKGQQSDIPCLKTSKTLENCLLDNDLILNFETDLIYLGLAYACTISKQKNTHDFEEIDYNNLIVKYQNRNGLEIKKKSAIRLIKHWQKVLSHFNVKTLQSHVRFLPHSIKKWTKYISNDYVIEDQRGRLCMPSLFALMGVYNLLVSMPGALIGLQVNLIENPRNFISRFTVYFEVCENGKIRTIDETLLPSSSPVYILAGCRYLPRGTQSWTNEKIKAIKEEFEQRSLKDVIFSHEVTYPQYPKNLKTKNIKPNESELVDEISKLKNLPGFSMEDPSDLCLVHIFVDDIQTQSLAAYEAPVYLPHLGE